MEKIIVCRCEEVDMEEIMQTAKKYQCSERELKLRTRAGMGYCAGRTCRQMINKIWEKTTREKPLHEIPLKIQPPVRPVTLAILGGQEENE
jgi:bacterioferritin-associated ferredoxin